MSVLWTDYEPPAVTSKRCCAAPPVKNDASVLPDRDEATMCVIFGFVLATGFYGAIWLAYQVGCRYWGLNL